MRHLAAKITRFRPAINQSISLSSSTINQSKSASYPALFSWTDSSTASVARSRRKFQNKPSAALSHPWPLTLYTASPDAPLPASTPASKPRRADQPSFFILQDISPFASSSLLAEPNVALLRQRFSLPYHLHAPLAPVKLCRDAAHVGSPSRPQQGARPTRRLRGRQHPDEKEEKGEFPMT